MLASRLVVSVMLVAGCQRSSDLGSRPHLLGKLADVDIHGTRAQLSKSFPELERAAAAAKDDVVDGPLKYRVWFDSDDPTRIESFIIFVARPLDDVLAAWGPGTRGLDGPDHYYVDEVAGVRFVVSPASEKGETDRCVIRAEPLIPLAMVLGSPGDVRLVGADLLYLPWGEVGETFTAHGLVLRKPPEGIDLSRMPIKFASSREFVTEVASCELTVYAGASGTEVVTFVLSCHPDVAGGKQTLLAAIDNKWGKPTRGTAARATLDRWIYPEAHSPVGEAVRISMDDGVNVEIHVALRDDPYGLSGRH
jgi:hypothetical protein